MNSPIGKYPLRSDLCRILTNSKTVNDEKGMNDVEAREQTNNEDLKMLENRPEDALVLLVKTVEIV